ncbi:DUF4166 domain-containing protein [uncultured Roseibium sp.]|uniref:DUF4166 domain-containing protein n=1 Tax=uncultured Roseibium sp. TaxID=1936171 RepID=UPI0026376692|nr:DUF4166 domain-containing protein [uncultured Roseibium sp.]
MNAKPEMNAQEAPCLFRQALGREFDRLPATVSDLHSVVGKHVWTGEARVTRGSSALGKFVCRMIGFPPESEQTPVSVTIERRQDAEIWHRDFGGKSFSSALTLRDDQSRGHVCERFGLLKFNIDLTFDGERLHFPVTRASLLGIPLPSWLLPRSEATEFQDDGRFNFDVMVSLPGIGKLVRYQGFLIATSQPGR